MPSLIPDKKFRGGKNLTNKELVAILNAAGFNSGAWSRIDSLDDLPDAVAGVRTLPPGTYLITASLLALGTDTLSVSGNTLIVGAGERGTIITSSATTQCIVADPLANLSLGDLGIQTTAGHGLVFESGSLRLKSVEINVKAAAGKDALRVDGAFATINVYDSKLFGDNAGVNIVSGSITMHSSDMYLQAEGAGSRPFIFGDGATSLRCANVNTRIRCLSGAEYAILASSSATYSRPLRFLQAYDEGSVTGTADVAGIPIGANLVMTDLDVG